ncbi:hypothetical protein, partial [Limnohabitans sp. Rim8]|uniref:hypothetical protein n=1 Tax=Limnohabitans sp. Rim8 TaxID=1100718 RepID=UPI001E6585B8
FGLLEESDDLLIGKSCGLHIRNSPKFADLLPLPWYGWQGAGHTWVVLSSTPHHISHYFAHRIGQSFG